jgi:hypothetical protein
MAADKQLVTYRSQDVAALDELASIILTGDLNVEAIDDPEAYSRQILAEIWAAETVEELERKPAEGWRDYLGIPMEIHSFTARPSDFENNALYFVIRAVDMTDGEQKILTTGSLNVCLQLCKLAKLGELPCIRVLGEDDTKSGNKVLFLMMAEDEAERRKAERVASRQGGAES